jgi:hypothetical protein
MAAPSLSKQVGRGAIWSVVNSALVQVINLLVFLVTARFVPVADFGILATCLLFVVVRYGLQALAIGFTVRAVLLYPLSVGAALHLLRIKPMAYAARIAPSLAASAVIVGALLLLHRTIDVPSPLLALVIHVAVGAVVYAAALFVIGRRDMLALIRFARTAVARG